MGVVGLRKKPQKISKYATFDRRLKALALDSFLILFLSLPFMHPVPPLDMAMLQDRVGEHKTISNVLHEMLLIAKETGMLESGLYNSMVQIIIYIPFFALCWHYWSATPGKMIMRMKLVDAVTEKPISDKQIALRLLGYIISTIPLFLGFCWVGFDKKKQGWHDKIAGTVVIVQPFPWRKLMWWKKSKQDSPAENQSNSLALEAKE
ncbi:MAG: RDD family protein [Alphaproteobacteria bacterium]|nr:RDD family protein [Alphaproteobacteria bacterium]